MAEELEPIREGLEALTARATLPAPLREYGEYLRTSGRIRRLPKLVDGAMAVAEKIQESGLPQKAWEELDEPLVTAILEGMSEEVDPNLQKAWENLLANTFVGGSVTVARAFPKILRGLDPRDAQLLSTAAEIGPYGSVKINTRGDVLAFQNLERSNLAKAGYGPLYNAGRVVEVGIEVTELGMAFVAACEPPHDLG